MRVSLFITCLADQLYPEVGWATVRVLEKLGCQVEFRAQQACCGQPCYNLGARPEAQSIARRFLDAFEGAECIVSPSGSCSAMLRHGYPQLFADDPEQARRARELGERCFELSQFLVQVLKVCDLGASFAARATYHPGCHATRLLGLSGEPLELLREVRGLELVPLEHSEDCCGFGGSFSVDQPGVSAAMTAEKVANVRRARPDLLIGGDLGCLMNIDGYLRAHPKAEAGPRVLHYVQVLAGATR